MQSLWSFGKPRSEESGNTDRLASHRKIDSLDTVFRRCNRHCGCRLTEMSMPDGSGLVTDSRPVVSYTWRRGFYRPRMVLNGIWDRLRNGWCASGPRVVKRGAR